MDTTDIIVNEQTRVLFIDQEYSIIDVARQVLERQDYFVSGFTSVEEAWEHIADDPEPYHALLIDPGYDLFSRIKFLEQIKKKFPCIKVIICTGTTLVSKVDGEAHSLVDSYLIKPYKNRELIDTVKAILS